MENQMSQYLSCLTPILQYVHSGKVLQCKHPVLTSLLQTLSKLQGFSPLAKCFNATKGMQTLTSDTLH